MKSKPLLISTWYRPPSAKIELFEKFENFLKLIDNEDKDIIITRDLNCNLIEHAQNHATSKLIDIIDIFQLQQHIQTPTRTTYNSSSLIDLILTHSSYQFKEELGFYTSRYSTSNDPNVLWNEFKSNFLAVAEKHAPIRQRRVKREHKPWLTKEIKRLMYHRDYLKRQSVRFTSSTYNEAYKRCKNKLNKLIKMTKEEYFKTKLSNANNSKNSWQAINELLNKKPKSTKVTQLNVHDQVITGDRNIADCFNQYFSSIGCKLSESIQNINIEPMAFVTPVAISSNWNFS